MCRDGDALWSLHAPPGRARRPLVCHPPILKGRGAVDVLVRTPPVSWLLEAAFVYFCCVCLVIPAMASSSSSQSPSLSSSQPQFWVRAMNEVPAMAIRRSINHVDVLRVGNALDGRCLRIGGVESAPLSASACHDRYAKNLGWVFRKVRKWGVYVWHCFLKGKKTFSEINGSTLRTMSFLAMALRVSQHRHTRPRQITNTIKPNATLHVTVLRLRRAYRICAARAYRYLCNPWRRSTTSIQATGD